MLKMRFLFASAFVCFLYDSIHAHLIKPCHPTDLICLKISAQHAVPLVAAGIPSLGMDTLDPMNVDEVKATQAGLNMDFKNTVVRGLRHCHVLDLKRLGDRTTIDLKCSVTLIGDYMLNGKLLLLPIEGEGKYKIQIHDIVVKVDLKLAERVSNGKSYWIVKDWTHTADVLGRVIFHFQNLFNGNKKLADPVIKFANSNWRDIFREVAPPIVKAVVSRIVTETSKLFDNVPISELALE